jgi:hypothetical protein
MAYIGATGLKTADLIDEAEEKSLLASLINSATDVITDDIRGRVEDAILSYFDTAAAAAEWRPSVTDVLSATGEIVQLGVLGELKMNKLDRSSVQDANSMVYTEKSQSTTNNIYWTDKVKIRYDNEWFSNALYYEGAVKKGEILTYRVEQGSNILNLDATNIKLGTINKDRLPSNFNNIGIGITPNATIHTYDATDNILRLQTAINGKVSIEFVKGTDIDTYRDYRFISENGTFKFQYEDDALGYGDGGTDLFTILPTLTTFYKGAKFEANVGIGTSPHERYKLDILGTSRFTGNVGIGTTPHETYKLDVNGDIRATEFRGGGANITGLNQDNLTLTTVKIYEKFSTSSFVNNNDKIDIPPVYTFNITYYESVVNPQFTTGSSPANTYVWYQGRFNCNFQDRTGEHSYVMNTGNLLGTPLILNYKVGDRITFKNTAMIGDDYVMGYSGTRLNSMLTFLKLPSSFSWTTRTLPAEAVKIFEWDGGSDFPFFKGEFGFVKDWTQSGLQLKRSTAMTAQIEAGFKYYLIKWQRVPGNGAYYGQYYTVGNQDSESSDTYFASLYLGGQGFKFISGYSSTGYAPAGSASYIPQIMTPNTKGIASRGARMSVTDDGILSADIPLSSDLLTNMNTLHFDNIANKIGILQTY